MVKVSDEIQFTVCYKTWKLMYMDAHYPLWLSLNYVLKQKTFEKSEIMLPLLVYQLPLTFQKYCMQVDPAYPG